MLWLWRYNRLYNAVVDVTIDMVYIDFIRGDIHGWSRKKFNVSKSACKSLVLYDNNTWAHVSSAKFLWAKTCCTGSSMHVSLDGGTWINHMRRVSANGRQSDTVLIYSLTKEELNNLLTVWILRKQHLWQIWLPIYFNCISYIRQLCRV